VELDDPPREGKAESGAEESFSDSLLEYPQYTRPQLFEGQPIPEVLLSGDHAKVAAWRQAEAELADREELASIRPDLDGHQIMSLLGITQGPLVGKAYARLLELRMEEGPLGPERATQELLRWAEAEGIPPAGESTPPDETEGDDPLPSSE